MDALRFTTLLRRARELAAGPDLVAARACVAEGLALWRGPAYADVPSAFAAEEAARLEELRLSALELAAELDLRAGRHAELVESLPVLVRAQPLREGLRSALMRPRWRTP